MGIVQLHNNYLRLRSYASVSEPRDFGFESIDCEFESGDCEFETGDCGFESSDKGSPPCFLI